MGDAIEITTYGISVLPSAFGKKNCRHYAFIGGILDRVATFKKFPEFSLTLPDKILNLTLT